MSTTVVGKSLRPAVTLIAAVLLASTTLLAQELTGTLYGKVSSEDGLTLPGATVTITSPRLMGAEVRVTNDAGAYRVPSLPPGVYTIKIEAPSFQTMTRADIVLTAGAVLGVDFVLKLSTIEETVTVTGESPLVDVKSTQINRTIENSALEYLPVGRSFGELIVTAPGVIDSEYTFQPSQTVHGSTVRDNVFNLDGAVINDNVVGYMLTDIPYDIIEEVQVTSGGISAEYGQASGAVFNFITKSGGNQISGGANYFLQNADLEWSNLTDDLIARGLRKGTSVTKNQEYGFSLGGPIRKDQIWFFGNIRWFDLMQSQPDFPAKDPTIDDRQGFVKLTAQLSSRTKIQGSYTQRDFRLDPGNASFATANNPENWSVSIRPWRIGFLGVTQVISDRTYLEGRYSINTARFDTEWARNEPGFIDLTTGIQSGGRTGPSGPYQHRDTQDIRASLTHFRERTLGGSHNIRFGYENVHVPFQWSREVPGDLVHLLQNGRPFRVRLYNTPISKQANTVSRHAAFIQDEWTIKERYTLNVGVRVESTEGWFPEQEGGGGRWFPVTRFPEERNQIKWLTAAPRLGLVWDVRGDRRVSVKTSFARYYEALNVQHVFNSNRNAAAFQEWEWIDANGDRFFQNGEQGRLIQDLRANLAQFDPDLRQPYVDEVVGGLDWQLGTEWLLSFTGIYKRERDIMENVDIGRPFSGYNPLQVVNPLNGQPMTIFALDRSFLGAQRIPLLTTPKDPVALYRDYKGLEMIANRRLKDGWAFQAALNVSRSYGNIGNAFGSTHGSSFIYDNPNTLINIEGPLDLDAPFQLKLQGTYLAPYGIALSAFYSAISGFPIKPPEGFPSDVLGAYTVRFTRADNPNIVVESFVDVAGEPRGTHRIDFRNKLSVRAEKQIEWKERWKLGLVADFFNVFNINTVTAIQIMRFGHPNFLKPAIIERPRAVRLGMRLSF